jgi:3-hydroxyisobutyrate dehydrogenase-like beta-hydroxyacid dehydrogenase
VNSTSSDFTVALAAKDLGLATAAADLPQLAAARDWLRAAAREGAADQDMRHVIEHIHPR